MKTLFFLALMLTAGQSFALSDQEAIDLGMTPVEELMPTRKGVGFEPNIDALIKKSGVVVVVDKSLRTASRPNGQTATVYVDGDYYSVYDVSTGTEEIKETTSGRRYIATTPVGIFRPIRAYTDYMSRTFLSAPMTWAVFFNGGIATHATTRGQYNRLGSRASGGCVRMRLEEAEEVNQLIVSRGEPNFRTVDQSEVIDDVLLKRILYINRDKFPVVDRNTGKFGNATMWTYDALIVVVGN
ncbi:MAG: hypothetical protein CME71_06410 [Halobacteriovorax sp.]|nr:hypothetical protein [Halobacteriovorax sp.]